MHLDIDEYTWVRYNPAKHSTYKIPSSRRVRGGAGAVTSLSNVATYDMNPYVGYRPLILIAASL